MAGLSRLVNTLILSSAIGLSGLTGPTPATAQQLAKAETTQGEVRHDHSENWYDTTFTSPSDIPNLESELSQHPTAIGYVRLSDLFFMAGKVEDAGKAAITAKRIDPQEWKAYQNLGTYHQKRNEQDLSIEYAKKCVTLCPNNPSTYHELGISYVWAKRYAAAKKSFQYALNIDSNYQPSVRAMAKLSKLMLK